MILIITGEIISSTSSSELVMSSLSRTPLHWATVCNNPEVIRALLSNGGRYSLFIKDFSILLPPLYQPILQLWTAVAELHWTMP